MFKGDVRVLLCAVYFSFKLQNEALELETSISDDVLHRDPGLDMPLSEIRLEEREHTEPTQSNLEMNEYAPLNPGTRSWEVERENVIIEKIIGGGAFGQVARGTATNLPGREGGITVAIKMLRGILLAPTFV